LARTRDDLIARQDLADAINAHLAVAWADYEAAQAARAAARPRRRRAARQAAFAALVLGPLVGLCGWWLPAPPGFRHLTTLFGLGTEPGTKTAQPEVPNVLPTPASPGSHLPVPRLVALLPAGSPSEPLRLEARKPARLPLQIRPEEAAQDSYILLLSGLPANATLSGASRMGADKWFLSPGALQQLEIVVPESSATVFEVGVGAAARQ
jgi:hypothetical protein